MQLENLETGESIPLSQDLGRGSVSCRVDPDALARGSMAVRGAIARGVELVIINKFGAQEVSGHRQVLRAPAPRAGPQALQRLTASRPDVQRERPEAPWHP